jgi:outer membrane receptor for ferrienterochelin and colicins
MLKPALLESDAVVVAATRSERDVEGVAVPVSVISKNDIARTGQVRLANVLNEQTGLQLVSNFGTGLQMQGFDPDYTLIMIDGEPVIGRSAGTLDLRRLAVANIKRIEIIKGPSSALWGSDALAGVVNIITDTPANGLGGDVSFRTATFGTNDGSINLRRKNGKHGTTAFVNWNQTNGYDLQPEVAGQTGPSFRNYSAQLKHATDLSESIKFTVQGRFFTENLDDSGALGLIGEQASAATNRQKTSEWSFNPVLRAQLSNGLRLTIRHYSTRYSNAFTNLEAGAEEGATSDFKQAYDKAEFQTDYAPTGRSWITLGGGGFRESVVASRYVEQPAFKSLFLYAQHEWRVTSGLDFVYGARLDRHSEYAPQFSPKLSIRYQPTARFTFRASGGRGFKAPDFRQLLLGFTNAVAGYSIFGSNAISDALQELQQSGNLRQITIDPALLGNIRAESSWAFNAGGDLQASEKLLLRANFFYNHVNDMIDVRPVAIKTNGASVFTYINLNRVFTRGAELELRWQPVPALSFSAGYQFLEAKDIDVLRSIEQGRVFRSVGNTGRVERVKRAEYGGLLNRSRHMANFNIAWTPDNTPWSANIRTQLRSRYGIGDFNGNDILDIDKEYAPHYLLTNVYLRRKVGSINVSAGIDNAFNHTSPDFQPFLAGRIFYLTLQYQL